MRLTLILTMIISVLFTSCATQYAKGPDGAVVWNGSLGGKTQAQTNFASFSTDHEKSFADGATLGKHAVWGSVTGGLFNNASKVLQVRSNNGVLKQQSNNALGTIRDNNATSVLNTANNNAANIAITESNNATQIALEEIKAASEVVEP